MSQAPRGEPSVTGTQLTKVRGLKSSLSVAACLSLLYCLWSQFSSFAACLPIQPNILFTLFLLPSSLYVPISQFLLLRPPPTHTHWLSRWPHLASVLSLCPYASTLCPGSGQSLTSGRAWLVATEAAASAAAATARLPAHRQSSSAFWFPSSGCLPVPSLAPAIL